MPDDDILYGPAEMVPEDKIPAGDNSVAVILHQEMQLFKKKQGVIDCQTVYAPGLPLKLIRQIHAKMHGHFKRRQWPVLCAGQHKAYINAVFRQLGLERL